MTEHVCPHCKKHLPGVPQEANKRPADVEITDEALTAAMRAFESMSTVLSYREKDKWHACDKIGMMAAIRAALPYFVEAK